MLSRPRCFAKSTRQQRASWLALKWKRKTILGICWHHKKRQWQSNCAWAARAQKRSVTLCPLPREPYTRTSSESRLRLGGQNRPLRFKLQLGARLPVVKGTRAYKDVG